MSELLLDEVRTWTFDHALPLWAERGVDRRHDGFLEELSFDGDATAVSFKRVRVICRQTYVFAHAAELGWSAGAELSRLGYEYMLDKARLGEGQWARVLSREGRVIDPAPDLYDLSCVILALAWRYRLSKDAAALKHAHATLDFIQDRLRAPHGGYWSSDEQQSLKQNPHMHLTEACCAAFEASGERRFLDQANELVGLLRRRLFDGETLGEVFSPDWRRRSGALEPGHHFEWAWILSELGRLGGGDYAAEAAALSAFAEAARDPQSGAVYDQVSEAGAPLADTSRSWPNTERLKAGLALFELSGADTGAMVSGSARLLLDRYLATPVRGLWYDQFDGAGRMVAGAVPASIFYHLFLAFSELLRVGPKMLAAQARAQ